MKLLLPCILVVAAAGTAVAQQGDAADAASRKGYYLQSREQCMDPSSFGGFLALGADSWGVSEGDAQRSVDLLAATVQCQAFSSDSSQTCDELARIPRFKAGTQLADECRDEADILAFYAAVQRRDSARAQSACAGWYERNRKHLFPEAKAADVCGHAVTFLLEDKSTACDRFGAEMAALSHESGVSRQAAEFCRAAFAGDRRACAEGLPWVRRSSCDAYADIVAALHARSPKGCPHSDRYGGLCRAMVAKDPAAACDAVRKDWQGLLCAPRFSSGGAGDRR